MTVDETPSAVAFMGLHATLSRALHEAFAITTPTAIQRAAIPVLLESERSGDVVMQAQTGSGKTLAFALPLLQRLQQKHASTATEGRETLGTVGLVIVPTRELAAQTQMTLQRLLSRVRPHWIVTTALTGGDSRKSEKARLRRGCQIVVGTPGRLLDHLRSSEGWRRTQLEWIVIDEADRLADMGFEATVRDIFAELGGAMERVQLVLLSATVTERVRGGFAGRKLNRPRFLDAHDGTAAADEAVTTAMDAAAPTTPAFHAPTVIDQQYLHVPTKLRLVVLAGLLRSLFGPESVARVGPTRVIVFFSCCDSVDFHYELFTAGAKGGRDLPGLLPPRIQVLRLHGSLEQTQRVATLSAFMRGVREPRDPKNSSPVASTQMVLFCTDVAARGLDIPGLAGSVQYDAPCDIHDYIHRAGRTGRMGGGGQQTVSPVPRSVLFMMPSEEAYVERLKAVGMTSLHRAPFDRLLSWVERLDARQLQDALKRQRKRPHRLSLKDSDDATEDTEEAALPATLRARVSLLQRVLEGAIATHATLSDLARNAFLSTVRAYATHPAAERDIFHVRRLHLGHLAASFGLAREPTKMLDGMREKRDPQESQRDKKDRLAAQRSEKRGGEKNSGGMLRGEKRGGMTQRGARRGGMTFRDTNQRDKRQLREDRRSKDTRDIKRTRVAQL